MAGHGIGLAGIPEVDTGVAAQNALVARAQGSLVPRQDQPPATTPQELGRRAAQPATAQPATARGGGRKPGTIDFEKDPLGSIGLILREAGAAIQNKPSPSAGVRSRQAGLELQAQGLRLKAASQTMSIAIKGMELASTIPPDKIQKFIADFQKNFGAEGFDVGSLIQDHYDGKLEGLLGAAKELRADPIAAAFFAQGEFGASSPKQLKDKIDRVLKLRDELRGKIISQRALAPGKVLEAGAIAEAKRPSFARIEAVAERRARGAASGAKFKRREVNLRDIQNDEIFSFVVNSPADEVRLDAMLSSKKFVKTSLDAKPQFQIVKEPVTDRSIVFNTITGRAEPLEDFFKRTGVTAEEGEAAGAPGVEAAPSSAESPRSGARLSEVLTGPAFFRQVKRAVGLTIGQIGEAFGTEAASFPELGTADTALGLFRNRMFSALRVKGQRLKIEAETLLELIPSSYAVLQSGPTVNRTLKELALRLNELRSEAERLSKSKRVPDDERSEARILAERLPNLIDDIFVTVKTPAELRNMPKGTTAFVLSEGGFFTRGK